ncbi:Neuropeptide FF receptor 2 [Trichoplax sp. H2]|nr:Neuropeptide FF receptor 2 [Trichoplax sp. H2]|eukprot:RDD40479.1 Neuropeptide FF receptor 2 [Trichoplax sp. H2]
MTSNISGSIISQGFFYQVKIFRIGLSLATAVIFTVGLLGNLCVIATLTRIRRNKYNSLMYYLILNLGIYDILVILIILPTFTVRNLKFFWPFGSLLCYLLNNLAVLLTIGSIATMVAIAMDRYWVVLYAASPVRRQIPKKVVTVIIFAISFVGTIPFMIYTAYDTSLPALPQCTLTFSSNLASDVKKLQVFSAITFGMLFVAPLFIVSVIYYRLLIILRRRSRNSDERISQTYIKATRKTIKMAILVNMMFIMCWIPWYMCLLTSLYYKNLPLTLYLNYYIILTAANTITFCHSAINPIIYAGFMHDFRQPLLHLYLLMIHLRRYFMIRLNIKSSNNAVNPLDIE